MLEPVGENLSLHDSLQGLTVSKSDRALLIQEIGKLGNDAKGALPVLKKLKLDPDQLVRDAATKAIEFINE